MCLLCTSALPRQTCAGTIVYKFEDPPKNQLFYE